MVIPRGSVFSWSSLDLVWEKPLVIQKATSQLSMLGAVGNVAVCFFDVSYIINLAIRRKLM